MQLPLSLSRTPLTRRAGVAWTHISTALTGLPPAWTSFALTLTGLVGGSVLALPIATAHLGPLPGVLVIALLGLVNMLTITALSEACIRSGPVRYGGAYFGGMVRGYLGETAGLVFSVVLFLDCFVSMLLYAIGIASTLASVSGVPPLVWAAALLAVQLFFLRRGGLQGTFASALVIGAVNITLLLALILLALPHVQPTNLLSVRLPIAGGQPLEPSLFQAVFGVILFACSGHLSTPTCARLVLRRDPSGRALRAGNVAAMCVAISLYSLWVVAIGGALEPEVLAAQSGTVLAPLAAVAGPAVQLMGVIFVLLSMGLGSIHTTLAISRQFVEWLPIRLRGVGGGWLGVVPSLMVFAVIAALFLSGRESFVGIAALFGTLALPLFVGAFPALLLLAARQRGECVPGRPLGHLGHPALLVAVVAFFLGVVLLHGLVIWERPVERVAAVLVAAGVVLLAVDTWRRGHFAPLAVVELRGDAATLPEARLVVAGQPVDVATTWDGQQLVLALPATQARELKVWAHWLTAASESQPLGAAVELEQGDVVRRAELEEATGWVVLSTGGRVGELRVALGRRQ